MRGAARNRPHLNICQGLLRDLQGAGRFDVVSADNVLEHLHDPIGFLNEAREKLKPDAYIVVRVPNFNNFARPFLQAFGRLDRSWLTDPDAHPCIWSRKSILSLMDRADLRPVLVMEHLMLTYPLKHILGSRAAAWPRSVQRAALKCFSACRWIDRLVPRGGIDVTVIAKQK